MIDIDHPDYWKSKERTIFGKKVWQPMTLTEFLLARIDEEEALARKASVDRWGRAVDDSADWVSLVQTTERDSTAAQDELVRRHDPARVLRECEAKREIVEAHRKWPVLITTPPKLETSDSADTMSVTMRMTQQIEWRTQEEYRTKFGDEPPTAPMIRALAMIYQDHPDFRDEWR